MNIKKMKIIPLILVFGFCLALASCNKVSIKGKEIAKNAEDQIRQESEELADKAFPKFDAYNADTKFNIMRFSEFLKVERTSDIKNIYCFEDAMGIDTDYQFSFHCNASTAKRILEKHNLNPDSTSMDFATEIQHDFDWWDKEKMEKLKMYSWNEKERYYKFFWYDEKEEKAYYFEFDV
jgi:hypothetical protein